MKPIVLVCPKIPPSRDGVGDYTYCLAAEIAKKRPVAIVTSQPQQRAAYPPNVVIHQWDGRSSSSLLPILLRLDPSFVNVQWVPFLWGKWGVNFTLPLTVLRLQRAGFHVVTTVHEPYVPFDRLKTLPMAIIQRLELWLLIVGSAKVAVSISAWTRMLQSRFFWRKRDIFWLPVGSNIPRLPLTDTERTVIRSKLGVGGSDLLVVMFNPGGTGKMVDLAARAWQAIRSVNPTARLLLIGCDKADAPFHTRILSDRVILTGYVQPDEVSRLLTSSDLYLAPYIDGISARRGSTIAALAHGLPTLSTTGRLTDHSTFAQSPLVLTPVGDEQAFIDAAERLAADECRRTAMRRPLIEFHQRHFSWPLIADRLVTRVSG